jgi:TonB-dependent starch-binding outer membrane protein SusC
LRTSVVGVCARAVQLIGLVVVATASAGVAAQAQDHGPRLTGKIVDSTDQVPISQAQILVTGTTIGAVSNDAGQFTLALPADAKTLTVRRIGYRQVIVTVTPGATDITVGLARDVLHLEQQVITGVATTVSSQNAANAVAVISSTQVNEVPAPTIENAIQGKVAGAIIQSNNGGAPGGGLQIQVRGVTSINGNASPLYVVDGVIINNETVNSDANAIAQSGGATNAQGQAVSNAPSMQDNSVNRVADLNPEDIESIEILKGASASAIYGSKASAGVVIITTKRGTAGKPKWNVNSQLGHFELENTLPIRTFPTLGSAQAWYVNDITHNTGSNATADSATIKGIYAGPQDFQKQLFGNKQLSYSTDVSVSGKQGETQYFVSGLAKYDNGIETNTGYNKQSIRANITQTMFDNLTVSANLNYVADLTRRGITGNDNIGVSPYNVFSYTPQFVALNKRNADGTWPLNPFGPANPFADATEINTPEKVGRFIGGGNINWQLFQQEHQSLDLQIMGGADITNINDLLFAPPDLQVEQREPSGLAGASITNNATIEYYNYSINLTHHYTGLSWLDATTSVGYARDTRSTSNPVQVGQGLLAGVNSPTAGTVQTGFYNRTAQRDQSFYVQEQVLTLEQRLALTAGVTAERSTADGDIGKFYGYPRLSASYRIPQFVEPIDELKVRFAYGQSGNLPTYGNKFTPLAVQLIDGRNGVSYSPQVGNPNARPEAETEMETGFDATLFHSRAEFSATVYQKQLSDLLLFASVAPSLGYSTTFINGGKFTNQGIELTLKATPIQFKNGFTWTSTTTFYRNYSVVNSLPVPAGPIGNTFGFGEGYLQVGRSVSQIVNGNAIGPDGQPIQVGDFQPSYRMSFGNELSFKGFRFYALVDWSRGGSTINLTDLYYDSGPQLWADSVASAKRFSAFAAGGTPYVQDASFVKLREMSLSYDLPGFIFKWFDHGRIDNAKIQLSGYNLLSWFKYPGLDPEISVNGNQTVSRGQDITPYPPARSYFIGLNLGF